MSAPKFSVEDRADRFQRRFTGPWLTVTREMGPVDVTYRYRRRTRIEFVRLAVAGHDLWVHAIFRGALLPVLLPVVGRISRLLTGWRRPYP